MSKSNQRFFDFIWKMVIDIGKDYEDDPLLSNYGQYSRLSYLFYVIRKEKFTLVVYLQGMICIVHVVVNLLL